MANKTHYVYEIRRELEDQSIPSELVRSVLLAQRKVLERVLKRDRTVLIPRVVRISFKGRGTLKVAFLTDFKVGLGILDSESVNKMRLRTKALSKLTKEEVVALGLKPPNKAPKTNGSLARVEKPAQGPLVLRDRILFVLGHDTLNFYEICSRLRAFGWMPKRRSSVSNSLSSNRYLIESPERSSYRAIIRPSSGGYTLPSRL
jgi:hypothetical protein